MQPSLDGTDLKESKFVVYMDELKRQLPPFTDEQRRSTLLYSMKLEITDAINELLGQKLRLVYR